MYFCGASISGPFYEYKDFQMYMKSQSHYAKIPSTVVPTLMRVKDLALFIGVQSVLAAHFKHSFMLTDEFAQFNIGWKMIYFLGNMWLRMATYVIGFCFMDCGILASGLAYSGAKDGEDHFDAVRNVNIKVLVFTNKVKYFLSCWNISVHEWLKNYVFMRMLPTGTRGKGIAKASFMSFMVSAIWHGFYPGFFSFFIGAFLMDFH